MSFVLKITRLHFIQRLKISPSPREKLNIFRITLKWKGGWGNLEKKMNCAFNVVVIAFTQHKKFHNKNKKVMKNTGKENKLKTLLLFSDSFLMCPLMMKMKIMMTRKMMEMPKLIEMMRHLSSIRPLKESVSLEQQN